LAVRPWSLANFWGARRIAGFWNFRSDELQGPHGVDFQFEKFGKPKIRQFLNLTKGFWPTTKGQRPKAND
jgi:hypothetical protein